MSAPLFAAALALLAAGTAAADLAATFPELTSQELRNEGIRLYYPRERAETATAPAWLAELEAAGVYASAPLRLRLGELPALTLICDSGPSADPSCRLLRDPERPEQAVFEAAGSEFAFLPDGRIYAGGHSNTFYDRRRLFRWDGSRFAEVRQPLQQVGHRGRLREAVELRMAPGADAPTMGLRLAAGSEVTVLLNANRAAADAADPDYLLLSADGLVGWAHLPGHPDGSSAVEGLNYRGD